MTPRSFIALTVVCVLGALPLLRAATPIEHRIARVENGLQKPNRLKGSPVERMKLAVRMEHYKVPGVSVAVIHAGRVEWARGYGRRDVESGAPVTAETLFQAASLSKGVGSDGGNAVVRQLCAIRFRVQENLNRCAMCLKVAGRGGSPRNTDLYTAEQTTGSTSCRHAITTDRRFIRGASASRVPQLWISPAKWVCERSKCTNGRNHR